MSFFSMFNPFAFLYRQQRRNSLHSGGVPLDVIDGVVELRTLDLEMQSLEYENFLVCLPSLIAASPELETINFDSALVSTFSGLPHLNLRHLVQDAIASACPTLKRMHCRLLDPSDADLLALFISQCKSLERLSLVYTDDPGIDYFDERDFVFYERDPFLKDPNNYFEPIKRAIRDHPMLKSFVLLGEEGGQGNCSLDVPKLILDLPHLESIEFKRLNFPDDDCEYWERITAAVEAHDNLKSFGIEAESMRNKQKGFFSDHLHDRIVNKLAINRAKAMLFRNWVVTLTAFRHNPAVVDYLIDSGVPGGGGAILWAEAVLQGLKAPEETREETREEKEEKQIQRHKKEEKAAIRKEPTKTIFWTRHVPIDQLIDFEDCCTFAHKDD
ncbi:expressed unknown protein [Seminavis robusta]|uniref:Uncharacterized protein n=1 Tax=Seminavis robusta TaxID=568900 RepID=A0A9N8HBS1_9STRA|nr:expressed unknown protein [Seminavis robusta]|eukprot:Sro350_g123660.1 n/a (385) ;mRNA; r:14867-16021